MKYQLVAFAVLSVAVCLFETGNALALQSQNGTKDCGSTGTLFTNLGSEPTDFELSADWGRPCELTLAWTDASGQPQTMKLATPGQPTLGISSSLGKGGVISWSTAPSSLPVGVGGGQFNWQLQRPPSLPGHPDRPEAEHRSDDDGNHGSATFGSVGGGFGTVASTPVSCGSSGTLYSNLTSAPITFDLVVTNYTNGDVYSCTLTMSWIDRSGEPQTLAVGPSSSQGVSSTSLPGGGVISWTSSGTASPGGLNMTWQVDRAVLIPGDGRASSR